MVSLIFGWFWIVVGAVALSNVGNIPDTPVGTRACTVIAAFICCMAGLFILANS